MARNLIVIYGPPLAGKTTLAWALGRSLAEKTAIVSTDQLVTGAIAVPDADQEAELDLAHVQLRLLVASYLKNGYHVIVEGPFRFERAGSLFSYESDVDQLIALMRNLATRSLIVRLTAPEAELRERAHALGRNDELAAALRLAAAYAPRYGKRLLTFDTSARSLAPIVDAIREALAAAD